MRLHSLIGRLRALNPAARLLTTHRGEATAARLFNSGLYNPETKSLDARAWLNAEAYEAGEKRRRHRHQHGSEHHHAHDDHHDVSRHDDHIRSFTFADERAISPRGSTCSWACCSPFTAPTCCA